MHHKHFYKSFKSKHSFQWMETHIIHSEWLWVKEQRVNVALQHALPVNHFETDTTIQHTHKDTHFTHIQLQTVTRVQTHSLYSPSFSIANTTQTYNTQESTQDSCVQCVHLKCEQQSQHSKTTHTNVLCTHCTQLFSRKGNWVEWSLQLHKFNAHFTQESTRKGFCTVNTCPLQATAASFGTDTQNSTVNIFDKPFFQSALFCERPLTKSLYGGEVLSEERC